MARQLNQLTRGVSSQCGWVWSRLPLSAQNWRIDFEFKASPYPYRLEIHNNIRPTLFNSDVCFCFLDLGHVWSFVWGWNGILAGDRTRARGRRILLERFASSPQPNSDTSEPHRTYTHTYIYIYVDEFKGLGIFIDTCVFVRSDMSFATRA
jgi:hypothetical protein